MSATFPLIILRSFYITVSTSKLAQHNHLVSYLYNLLDLSRDTNRQRNIMYIYNAAVLFSMLVLSANADLRVRFVRISCLMLLNFVLRSKLDKAALGVRPLSTPAPLVCTFWFLLLVLCTECGPANCVVLRGQFAAPWTISINVRFS